MAENKNNSPEMMKKKVILGPVHLVIAFILFAAVIFLGIKVIIKYIVKKPITAVQNHETLPFKRITMLNPTPLYANPNINDVLQETLPAGTNILVDKIIKNKWTFFRIKTDSSYRWVIAQFVQHIPVNISQGQSLPIGNENVNVNNPLPYNYKPADLQVVNKKYLSPYDMRRHALRKEALKVFCKIIDDARQEGIKLVIVSAFRSAPYQMRLYKNALNKKNNPDWMGTAKPTYSEHQLGTAVDFSCPEIEYDLNESFENTRAYSWLKTRLEKYGIRLSYPRNNAEGYIYEPWHYRYIGNRQN